MSTGRKVLVAMDGSENAAQAFKWYYDNMRQPDDYVIITYCAEYYNITYGSASLAPGDPSFFERVINEEEKRIHTFMDHLESLLQKHNIKGEVLRLKGEPGHAIVQQSETSKATMIVTGSRGMGTIRRTLMGSVSDYIVHHSHVPVLVCKHGHHEHQQHHQQSHDHQQHKDGK